MKTKLVQTIDYKKRDWRRDIGINLVAIGFVITASVSWYKEFLSITPPIMLIAAVLAFVPHELMHALFFKIWGGKVKFGAMMTKFGPAFYAASPGTTLSRNRMIVVALAPQVLTVIFLVAAHFLSYDAARTTLILTAVLNCGGGCGDYYGLLQMIKYSKKLQIEDSPSGLKFYMPVEGEL